jgi:hypothetical protein
MDELVTLEEGDGGSDILLVVPKATVLQVRKEQQTCSWVREAKDIFVRGTFPLYLVSSIASAEEFTGYYTRSAFKKVSTFT